MSRRRAARRQAARDNKKAETKPDSSRRKVVIGGAGLLALAGAGGIGVYKAGWFDNETTSGTSPVKGRNLTPVTLTSSFENALKAVNEMLEHYTNDLDNPSALIHAVRGFGKNFTLSDGTKAVDRLCSGFASDKEVNGKRYVYFKREAEVHENSFLKTFLEAGVEMDRPVIAGDGKYTLQDVVDGGKALFRCDSTDIFRFDENRYRYDQTYFPPRQDPSGRPVSDMRGELIHEHLPWGLIAFSMLVPPTQAGWTNAYGEKIDLAGIINRSLAEYESTCNLGIKEISGGNAAPVQFREAIKKYSCFGLHTIYSYLVCINKGYGGNGIEDRVKQMVDFLTYRLKGDADAIDREYAAEGRGAPPQLVEAFRVRARVKFYGHVFEAINYARLHNLIEFNPGQERRIKAGEEAFYGSIIRLRAIDWGMMRNSLGEKFISDVVIALGHAARAMKLLTPQSPDPIA